MPSQLRYRLDAHVKPNIESSQDVKTRKCSDEPRTLLGLLQRAAHLWPNNGIAFKDQGWDQKSDFMTYADLLTEAKVMLSGIISIPAKLMTSKSNAAKLLAHGAVTPNQCTVLYFDSHRNNTIWFWSTVVAGGVPAMLSPLSSNDVTLAGELDNVNKLFNSPTILTTKHLAKPFRLVTCLNTITVEVVATVNIEDTFETTTINESSGREDELATVLFTSGSTGFAKGVEYTHSQLVASSKLKCQFHRMDSSKTFMSWVSKYHQFQESVTGSVY